MKLVTSIFCLCTCASLCYGGLIDAKTQVDIHLSELVTNASFQKMLQQIGNSTESNGAAVASRVELSTKHATQLQPYIILGIVTLIAVEAGRGVRVLLTWYRNGHNE